MLVLAGTLQIERSHSLRVGLSPTKRLAFCSASPIWFESGRIPVCKQGGTGRSRLARFVQFSRHLPTMCSEQEAKAKSNILLKGLMPQEIAGKAGSTPDEAQKSGNGEQPVSLYAWIMAFLLLALNVHNQWTR